MSFEANKAKTEAETKAEAEAEAKCGNALMKKKEESQNEKGNNKPASSIQKQTSIQQPVSSNK